MINRIYELCRTILTITDEEFDELYEVAKGQSDYVNPLKPATTDWQNRLGQHNKAVLDALKALKSVIAEGADIVPPIKEG